MPVSATEWNKRVREIWRSLDTPQRRRLVADMASLRETRGWPQGLEEEIAHVLHFRPAKIRRASTQELERLLPQAALLLSPLALRNLIVGVHLEPRKALLEEVYDALQVPHDGVAVDDQVLAAPLSISDFDQRLPAVLNRYGFEDTLLCFQVLEVACSEGWRPGVESIRRELETRLPAMRPSSDSSLEAEPSIASEPVVEGSPPSPAEEVFQGLPGFTTLDGVLIRAIISSLNEVEGSLSLDELDDLVLELVDLNETRERSRFFLGYLDALLARPLKELPPGDNNSRRAWYLSGFLHGLLRIGSKQAALESLIGLEPSDRDRLLASPSDAGALLAIEFVPFLLKEGRVQEAEGWLHNHFPRIAPRVMGTLLAWARREVATGDAESVRRILEGVGQWLPRVTDEFGPLPEPFERDLRRRLATAWRRTGRSAEARLAVEELLASSTDDVERAGLLSDRAMLDMGVRSLEQVQLGPPASRSALLAAIDAGRDQLTFAAALPTHTPLPPLLLALHAVANKEASDEAIELGIGHLRDALGAIQSDVFWRQTGIQQRAKFYLSLLELRSLREDLAAQAANRLVEVFEDQSVDLPDDLVAEALEALALYEAPNSGRAAVLALGRWPTLLGRVAFQALATRNTELRLALRALVSDKGQELTSTERWCAWEDLLLTALRTRPRDLETARVSLDELERLAVDGLEDRFLALLDDRSRWDPAWTHLERDEARVRLLESTGRLDSAAAVLNNLIHREISDGEEVADLIERLAGLPVPPGQIEDLQRRVRSQAQNAGIDPASHASPEYTAPVRVLFVGGNETQMTYRSELEAWFSRAFPGSTLEFEFSGWSSNWGRLMDRIRNRVETADVIVLMRFMRTEFGRELRRSAGEHGVPWVGCPGHGRQSLEKAIARAVAVANARSASLVRIEDTPTTR